MKKHIFIISMIVLIICMPILMGAANRFSDPIICTGGVIEDTDNEDLVFRTNSNANQVVLDSAGSVGIGTAAPYSKLSFGDALPSAGTVGNKIAFYENTSTGASARAIGFVRQADSTYGIGVWADTTTTPSATNADLYVADTGNVGIGTAAPGTKLTVVGDADFQGGDIQNSSGTTLTTPEEWHITAAEGCFADKYNPQTTDTDTYINFAADQVRIYAGGTLMVDALEGTPDVGTLGGDAWWVTNSLNVGGGYTATGVTISSAGAISCDGQITSSVTTGTAPLVVASTTQVSNLNCSMLIGNTWAIPGTIGSTTPNTGAFTTLAFGGGYASTGGSGDTSGNLSLAGNLVVDGASSNKETEVTAFTGASTDTLDATGKHTVVLDLAAGDTLVNITNGVTGQRLKLINIDAANAPVIDDEGGNIDLPGSNVDITIGGVYDNIELTYITTDTVNKWVKTGGDTGY